MTTTIPSTPESRQRERIHTEIYSGADEVARLIARELATLITSRAARGLRTVLGLATGSTPVRLYRELIRLHREEKLSFRDVVTFNLDEYYGLPRTHPESYWRFMHEQFFNHVDIPAENIHVPDGTVPRHEVFNWCAAYEQRIRDAGGIDCQILGIGRTGHIGFNEPGSTRDSRTRLVTLDGLTRADAARDFLGEGNVPRHAITMGVGTILEARSIVLLAWGGAKARVLAAAVEGEPCDALPASLLQHHPATRFLLDEAAASALTRACHPWLVGGAQWSPMLAKRAVTWLSREAGKPVLKLLDEHYNEHGMADLITAEDTAYDLNIRVFNQLQHTISGWPGGKPGADDTHRPERAQPHPKRVLILTPEPLDDVLGMGGTMRRLVEQGHDVTVAHLTSGSLSVPDEEAVMAADLVLELGRAHGAVDSDFARDIVSQLEKKTPFDLDSPSIRKLKAILRRSETHASLRACGIRAGGIRFLDLPFYENGRYRQFSPAAADLATLAALLRDLKPHQIFTTGDGDDPSSVSAICFGLFLNAMAETRADAWRESCRVWLYSRPGSEPDPAGVDMAMPLSPVELRDKIHAILHHKSQRSQNPGEGESWQQAELNNRALARAYDQLGLADYEAIESFRRWPATA
ncbi:MAG: glucosamine-6-phosphate deaminase [Opitutaceae bacterium]|jgi:glucosamine-6-phosphate deaminase|nr:glucosamine-6-phosphate deaminase [Opitutaceae bacterium]